MTFWNQVWRVAIENLSPSEMILTSFPAVQYWMLKSWEWGLGMRLCIPVSRHSVVRWRDKEALEREGSHYDQTRLQAAKGVAKDNQLAKFYVNRETLHDSSNKGEVAIVGVD